MGPIAKKAINKSASNKEKPTYRFGQSPEMDAWLTSFFIENHLDYYTYPDHAATEEQVRFMVYTEPGERYQPCSDLMFEAIISRKKSAFLQEHYKKALDKLSKLVLSQIEDPYEKDYLLALLTIKHKHETRDEIMIPSRVEKRLMSIYLRRTQIGDPYWDEKVRRNALALDVLNSDPVKEALDHVELSDLEHPPETLTHIKSLVGAVELKRLLSLACTESLWKHAVSKEIKKEDYLNIFSNTFSGNGLQLLLNFLGFGDLPAKKRKLLWLANEAGELVMDLAVIRFLVNHGHKVIIALKDGPLYTKPTISDVINDPVLETVMSQAAIIDNANMSKNELVRTLRGDVQTLALSDGTSENSNLLLASTTFARVFKEVDAIISRGLDQRRRFFDTHFEFTQDIYSIAVEKDGSFSILFKARHPEVIKFSHNDLEAKAATIIDQMKESKSRGMTVIFYSGIIGSIPGKIEMAKKIMSIFVDHLNAQSDKTFIINPSEYYEPGMDADDLMYMWEIVQRSGQIDIWRFQTYQDIVKAFEISNQKVPPEWVGKDATFSTGCTKEMNIAIDVQHAHPEMQIIGPAKERFMRRQEYGVGQMYDRRLSVRTRSK